MPLQVVREGKIYFVSSRQYPEVVGSGYSMREARADFFRQFEEPWREGIFMKALESVLKAQPAAAYAKEIEILIGLIKDGYIILSTESK